MLCIHVLWSAYAHYGQYLFDEPLAALMSSSAKHSAMVLIFRKEDSRAPVEMR